MVHFRVKFENWLISTHIQGKLVNCIYHEKIFCYKYFLNRSKLLDVIQFHRHKSQNGLSTRILRGLEMFSTVELHS
jgi:hypothetical protein